MATLPRFLALASIAAAALPLVALPVAPVAPQAAALPISNLAPIHAEMPSTVLRVKSFCRRVCVSRFCPPGTTHNGPHGYTSGECWRYHGYGEWHIVRNLPCHRWKKVCNYPPGMYTHPPRHIDRPYGHSRTYRPLYRRPLHPPEPVHRNFLHGATTMPRTHASVPHAGFRLR